VAQVIGPELRLESISRFAKWCGHHPGVGDDYVEGLALLQQSIGASPHAFQIGEIEFDQLETAAVRGAVLSHLRGRAFGFVQVARRPQHLRAMRGKRPRRLNPQTG
jgi:hypothetical protein